MSKRRSLAGITADNQETSSGENVMLPVTAMATGKSILDNPLGESKRTFEYEVDPESCLPWKYHNRDDAWMNSDRCKDLISSIRKNGQQFPVQARPLEKDPNGYKWEIVAGRRRWFACKYLKIKLKVKPIDASDRECAILMNLENKDRDDVSEFEDAISYRQQLEARLFDSQDDMAAALDLNKSKLSKMLAAAKIVNHTEVMRLFNDITTLKVNPAYQLVTLLEKSDANKDVIYQKAKNIHKSFTPTNHKLGTPTIINKLLQSIETSSKTARAEPKLFKFDGKTVLKAHELSNGRVSFEFNKKNINGLKKEDIIKMTLEALDDFVQR